MVPTSTRHSTGMKRANETTVIDGDAMTVGGSGKRRTYRFTRLAPQ
ncbi:hypothetical protein J0H58_34210 [bacterium]|nr:hypothetical protein [bacterium]